MIENKENTKSVKAFYSPSYDLLFNKYLKLIKNDISGLNYFEMLVDATITYVDSVIEQESYNRMAAGSNFGSLKNEDLEKQRTGNHNSLITLISMNNIYLKRIREKRETFLESIYSKEQSDFYSPKQNIGDLIEIENVNRSNVGDWAGELVFSMYAKKSNINLDEILDKKSGINLYSKIFEEYPQKIRDPKEKDEGYGLLIKMIKSASEYVSAVSFDELKSKLKLNSDHSERQTNKVQKENLDNSITSVDSFFEKYQKKKRKKISKKNSPIFAGIVSSVVFSRRKR